MNWLELAGTAVGMLYLYWEYKASSWLWVASIAMPALYLNVYFQAGLYADFAISVYYIIASFYGLIVWLRQRHFAALNPPAANGQAQSSSGIRHTPHSLILPLTLAGGAIMLILYILLSNLTDSTVPWADAFTTALSIIALWMLAKKYIEQWLVWIVVDIAYVALYLYKGLYLTSGLYLVYSIVAVAGYVKWNKLMKHYE